MLSFTIVGPEEMAGIAKQLLAECNESKIFTFNGNLGAGKTTLIRYLCRELGYKDEVTSPTFTLINEYQTSQGLVFHMDLYRVKNIEEALDFGIEEYIFSGNYCFIEWPEVIADILDMEINFISITATEESKRKIEVKKLS